MAPKRGRRPDEGGSSTLEALLSPLTLALSLRERGYIDATDED